MPYQLESIDPAQMGNSGVNSKEMNPEFYRCWSLVD